MGADKSQTAILGAGVTGLQTALSLLSTNQHDVFIVAQHFPPDWSIEYTSPWAGGQWRSHAHSGPEDAEVRAWDAETYRAWRQMLAEGEGQGKSREELGGELGLGVKESVMYWSEETDETRNGGEGLWWRNAVAGFEVLGEEERSRVRVDGGAKVVFAAKYESVCINVPQYLRFLMERVVALGGKMIRATIRTDAGVKGVMEEVKRIVTSSDPSQQLDVVVLATGLSSKHFLPADEAEKLFPVRGQTVLVKGEAPKAVTHIFPSDELSYVIPRPGSGTTILGGCKQADNWDEKEDPHLTKRILRRARILVPELLGADGEFKVISIQVGRRPGRRGGPRIEMEKERVNAVKVVHAYGHSGAGYQNSIGSAGKIVKLLERSKSRCRESIVSQQSNGL